MDSPYPNANVGDTAAMLNRIATDTENLAQRGADAVREGSQRLRGQALRATDRAVAYIRDEPIKSVFIATATGAALMTLIAIVGRAGGARD